MIPNVEPRSKRGAELLGLLAFALALMLLIALATFDPRDPAPFFKAGVEGPARNFIGPFGAFLAEMLVPQLFGLASLLLPIVLGLLGWKLFWCRPIEAPYTKAVGNVFLLASLAGLLALAVGTVSYEGEPVRAGGAVGEILAGVLVSSFSRTGAYIVSATALFAALILATQFSFSKAIAAVTGRLGERLRAIQTAWAHYLESRRKEKLRRDVILKHTAAKETEGSLLRIRKVRPGRAEEAKDAEVDPGAGGADDDLPLNAPPPPRPVPVAQRPLPFVSPDPGPEPERAPASVPGRRRRADRDDAERGGEFRGRHTLPPVTIFDEAKGGGGVDNDRLLQKGRILQSKCSEFGVMGTVKEIHPGPVVTTYE
ncbi:MAG TPA: DNA translocase FtsK 4TM domain-containing protein, partial [Vicinamibacteria bacterium]